MPYSAEISRSNPACFLFLIDQSGSMDDPFGGSPGRKKAEGVADAANSLLQNLVLKCAKEEGIRDYFNVGVLGYGGSQVTSALGGPISGQDLLKISEIGNAPLRLDERTRKREDGRVGWLTKSSRSRSGSSPSQTAVRRCARRLAELQTFSVAGWLSTRAVSHLSS